MPACDTLDLIQFFFDDLGHFLGLVIVLVIVCDGVCGLIDRVRR